MQNDKDGKTGERDASAREASDRRARALTAEELGRAMLEALPQIAFIVRPDGAAEYYNRRFLEYFQAAGVDTQSRMELVPPEGRAAAAGAGGGGGAAEGEWEVELRLGRRDGGSRGHRFRGAPLWRAAAPPAYVCSAVDVDDVRRAELALRRTNEALGQRVA